MSEPNRPRAWALRLRRAFGVTILVTVVVVALLRWWAEVTIDRRTAALETRLSSLRSRLATDREVIAGPSAPGNAADWYRELEERFSDIQRANAGAFADEVVRRDIPAHLEEGAPETDAMREVIERYGELAALAREGVSRERCDWEHPLEQGQRARLPIDIKSARLAGLLLYLEARRSRDASQALQRSVELIAFGRDLLRHPSLILGMMGLAVQSYGYRAIALTLEGVVSRSDLVWVLEALDRLGPVDATVSLESDRIACEVEIASVVGRAVGEPSLRGDRIVRRPHVPGAIYFAWDWGEYVRYRSWQEEIGALPHLERQAASEVFLRDVERSWGIMTQIAVAHPSEALVHFDTANATHDLVRVLVATHLHHVDVGKLPRTLSALTPYLGEEPRDPFRSERAPLSLVVDGEEGRIYSWYLNGVDDGAACAAWGKGKTADLVVVTRAPK